METLENRKKKIIYRCTYRGSKENDILLGNFAKKYIDQFNDEELNELEQIIEMNDNLLYDHVLLRVKNDKNSILCKFIDYTNSFNIHS